MTIRRLIALLAAAALLYAVLAMPEVAVAAPGPFPLELPALLVALVALPARNLFTLVARGAAVLWLVLSAMLRAADYGMLAAFNRPFDPVGDLPLAAAGYGLLQGSVGPWPAGLAAIGGALAVIGLAAALWWATGTVAALEPRRPLRLATAGLAVVAAGLAAAEAAGALDPPGTAAALRATVARVATARATLADVSRFTTEAAGDPYAAAGRWLDRLGGRDVLVVFVESYGRSSFDNPLYRSTHVPTLASAASVLAARGLAMRSGWLTSPIAGGRSWLAHGTFASGLRTDSQNRYGAMLASPRRTLFEIAAASGFRTAAVVPAITMAWPEGRRLGFEDIRAAADLGYRGRPFNWITMPDQYTLAAADRLLRDGTAPLPLFAEIVLISSHAPWVPVPERVDWDAVGDGTVFDRMAAAGDPPEVVWRDPDRVRDQYRLAIDYSLATVMDYLARQAEPALAIVLGDHQPAPFVAGIDSRDVPVHVVGPPDLVAAIDDWGWTAGLVPDAATPVWPMEAFRDRFMQSFSSTAPAR